MAAPGCLEVEHPPYLEHQTVDPGNSLGRRAVLEEGGESLEVEFDAVAVVSPHGFFDEPEDILPNGVMAEVESAGA